MERNNVITIATTLFIRIRIKKFTTGLSKMAIRSAKTSGIMRDFAMYNPVSIANIPMKTKTTFTYNGN
jgi:hypothetical protein